MHPIILKPQKWFPIRVYEWLNFQLDSEEDSFPKTLFIYWLCQVPIKERIWNNFDLVLWILMNNVHQRHDAFLDMHNEAF
jgi:hypothetical protein